MPQESYEYAIGRVSVMSTKMLKQNQLRRIAEAPTVKEATAILIEAGYGEGNITEEEIAYGELDLMIREQMNLTRKRILELTPDVELTGLFLLNVDNHNLKTLLKARLLKTDGEKYLRDGGFFPLELVKTCIATRKYDSLPKVYRNAFNSIEADIARKTIDPMRFSAMIDCALFTYAQEILDEKEEHGFIREYFNLRADFQNALSLVRARLLHWGPDKLRMLLLDCGEIDKKYYLESMDTPFEQLGARLNHGSHGIALAAALNDYVQRQDIAAIADVMRKMLMDILRKVRWDTDNLGPIIGYLKARDAEAQALRVIFGSKQGGFEAPLPQLFI